jgi:hypothetical protein
MVTGIADITAGMSLAMYRGRFARVSVSALTVSTILHRLDLGCAKKDETSIKSE